MSHEKATLGSIDAEYRISNVNYEEFINGVKERWESEEAEAEPMKVKQPNAEDEVVAILLSAMMGSIVRDWRTRTSLPAVSVLPKKSSGDVSEVNSAEEQSPGGSQMEDVQSEGTVGSQKKTVVSTPSRRQPTLITLEGLNSVSEELSTSKTHRLDSHLATPGQTPSISRVTTMKSSEVPSVKTSSSIQLKKLKELLASDREYIYGWDFLEPDREFSITFKRGNRYEGKLLNCRMHGEGKFYWADGGVYEGRFVHGRMTGPGKLRFPDGSWYEGEFCRGYRHGRGLYVVAPTFYAGYWRCGRRHGPGAMFYNHFDTDRNFYNGEWAADLKHGTGLRCYPSGAKYSGQWKYGRQCGLGTMVWTNSDVYSGNFHRGRMHGYGEYTWDTFYNRQLVVPEENCYYGDWERNVRHGNGTLETTTGVVVKGSWRHGRKHGAAEVICSNGNFLYDDNLFEEDNICLPDSNVENDSLMNVSVQSNYRLPVSAASHEINLGYYVGRLVEFINECSAFGKPFCPTVIDGPVKFDPKRTFSFNRSFEPEGNKIDFNQEEACARNVLMQFQTSLRMIYAEYSQLCCDQKPTFPTILMRLMWWQLLRDCDLHTRGFSLADFDICIANNRASLVQGVHYPFERLLFWQFLHCLVEVSWQLYAKKCEGTPTVKGIIAAGLHKLITEDIIPHAGHHKGNALFGCRELLSFDALYWYYRGIGEPHSARHFLKQASVPLEEPADENKPPEYFDYQVRGRNVIGVGGKLTYFPHEEPLLKSEKYQEDPDHPKNLSCLSDLGLQTILECILQVCPNISSGELLVNMDYQIVFLEFYEILLLCASKKAKKKIAELKEKERLEEDAKGERTSGAKSVPPSPSGTVEEPTTQTAEDLPSPKKSRKKSSGAKKPKKKKS